MPTDSRTPDGPVLTPVLDFLRALWELNHRLEVASSEMLRTRGITAQQRMLLRVVQHLEPISAGLLAETLHVHPGTLSTSLRRLEQRGLLSRQRDSGDGRRVHVSLTEAGRTLASVVEGTVEASVDGVLRSTGSDVTRSTLDMLRRLSDALPVRSENTGAE